MACWRFFVTTLVVAFFAKDLPECQGALQKVLSGWTSPINYNIDATLSATTQATITSLLSTTIPALVPGLRFVNSATQPYIQFSKDASRTKFCEDENVQIGKQNAGITVVSITESLNCNTQGWILHLLMHAIGFYHEHQRSDRGNYIYINMANSGLSDVAKAALLDVQSSGIIVNAAAGYDWESVTHYDYQATASSAGKMTIVALPAEYYSLRSYGHATNTDYSSISVLSNGDVVALQALFPGTSSPQPTPQVCYNGGTWYNWCLCKPGYGGRFCNQIVCPMNCQNSGSCSINATTGLPQCICPSGYSGTYCEITGTSPKCSADGGVCPWWSACNPSQATCTCDPYPYYGPTCSFPIITVPTTSTVATTTGASTATTTSNASTTTPAPIACTATNVGAPRSITYAPNAVYLRMALADVPYIADFSNLGSSNSVALQNFLAEALQGDYQTQSSGQFISILIQNIQPPFPNSNIGCAVVDFLAKFTSNLSPLQRTHVVQASYAKSTSSNLPSLFGNLGTNPNKATRVSSVLYITPLNSAISPASPCVVFSSEGSCQHGGTCSGSGTEPTCTCTGGYMGPYCNMTPSSNVHLAWPIWQIVVVSIAAAIVILLFILLVTYFVRQGQKGNWRNYMWNGPDRYYDYDMRARHMPTYMVAAEPQPVMPSYYPQAYPGSNPTAVMQPPPYGGGNTLQRPKHYQYPYNIQ